MVDVVDHHRVERRAVQLGRAIGNRLEILSGLAAGDTVVLRNVEPSAHGKEAL
jgi:multidrug efflux pump subunit AcrA (membrane-fusion protein)